MIEQTSLKFETNSNYSILLHIKYDYDFLTRNYNRSMSVPIIANLLRKGKRTEVKQVNTICHQEFLNERYSGVRKYLLNDGEDKE